MPVASDRRPARPGGTGRLKGVAAVLANAAVAARPTGLAALVTLLRRAATTLRDELARRDKVFERDDAERRRSRRASPLAQRS
jgi:hypothetical protein